MDNNAKKYSIIGIVIVLLILIGAFALLRSPERDSAVINSSSEKSSSTTKNTDNSEIANSEEEKASPVKTGGSVYSDAGVTDVGKNEISGTTDEVGLVGETGYEHLSDFSLQNRYEYKEQWWGHGDLLFFDKIKEKSLYMEIKSLRKGQFLDIDFFYFDDNGKKIIWRTFQSKVSKKGYSSENYYYTGCFDYPDNPYSDINPNLCYEYYENEQKYKDAGSGPKYSKNFTINEDSESFITGVVSYQENAPEFLNYMWQNKGELSPHPCTEKDRKFTSGNFYSKNALLLIRTIRP